jgi:hypothetical protein
MLYWAFFAGVLFLIPSPYTHISSSVSSCLETLDGTIVPLPYEGETCLPNDFCQGSQNVKRIA